MPGYSGTPLPKKLGIKAGFRVWLANAPAEVRAELREALAECEVAKPGDALDFAMMSTKSRAELAKEFSRIAKRLAPASGFGFRASASGFRASGFRASGLPGSLGGGCVPYQVADEKEDGHQQQEMNQNVGYVEEQEAFGPENEQQHGDHKERSEPHTCLRKLIHGLRA